MKFASLGACLSCSSGAGVIIGSDGAISIFDIRFSTLPPKIAKKEPEEERQVSRRRVISGWEEEV